MSRDAVTNTASHWSAYEPGERRPWNLKRVVHLHRRAAFAASWPELQRDLQDGPHRAIDRLLEGRASDSRMAGFEGMARVIGDAASASGSPSRLKAWWIFRMLFSPDPLGERLTLMWHNHFATSNRKVQDLVRMREQNELFREYARRPFAELLGAVVKHPAMLVWLDADSNHKGHPNENLARELMELFTIGVGNYTETDVKEAARALTGWDIVAGQFAFRATRHDGGEKVVLGTRGELNANELLSLLSEHPATARRLAWRISHTFMGEGVVDAAALAALAEGLEDHNLDLNWAVESVIRSELFFSDANIGARVSSPVEYVVSALRALELDEHPPSTLLLADWTRRMGQDLFYPPNVGGWNEGRAWLGSRTVVARANFAAALAGGRLWQPDVKPEFEAVLKRNSPASRLDDQTAWLATLLWGEAPGDAVQDVVKAATSSEQGATLAGVVAQLLARPEHYLA